jgi:threonyl-tRNA synthetase
MSAQITVHVADTQRSVAQGTTAGELFEGDRSVLVARVDGELRDLAHVLVGGEHVEPVTAAEQDGLDVLRHSAAHVLAQAVQEVHPDARLGIGPPIRDGFYYDFDVATPFTPEDLKALEKVMQRIINEGQTFHRREISDEDALVELAGEPYKCELIGLKGGASEEAAEGAAVEVGGAQLTIYDNVRRDGSRAWGDLCRGPHVPSTKVLGNAFKLMRSAAAYWRGSEKNKQLQRVYGTAWPTKDEHDGLPRPARGGRARDHRKLGPSSTCSASPTRSARGCRCSTPRAASSSAEMEDYVRRGTSRRGSSTSAPRTSPRSGSSTPPGTCRTTGPDVPGPRRRRAWPVPPQGDELPDAQPHLPLARALVPRAAAATVRVRHGLPQREVRGRPRPDPGPRFRPGRLALLRHGRAGTGEIKHLLDFCLGLFRDFGLDDFYLELSTRDETRQEGQVHRHRRGVGRGDRGPGGQSPRVRARARADPGGAAYYGPKISVQARDAIGRTWQMSTIQYDFNQPERFDLEYQASDGTRQQPVMIHSAKFGSIERFIGVSSSTTPGPSRCG